MEHTKKDLILLQSLPLSIKMEKTKIRIIELAQNYDFYVSFSGGKDSEVAVDLTAKILSELGRKKMYVLNINTGLEYISVQKFCKPFCELVSQKYGIDIILDTVYPEITFNNVLKKYGYPIISKEISQCIYEARKGLKNNDGTYQYRIDKLNGTKTDSQGKLSQYNYSQYRFLMDAPFQISHLCCKKIKKDPAIKYEKNNGRIPLIATTTEESQMRRTAWLKSGCNAFKGKRPHSAPFSFWKNQDMLEYIHTNNLPLADAYGEIVPYIPNTIEGQINLFEETQNYNGCQLCTTGCPRTGCIYCLFGITQGDILPRL